LEHGYAFAGANAWRAEKIDSVKNLMSTLASEYDSIDKNRGYDIR
jgi:hypothetical protein